MDLKCECCGSTEKVHVFSSCCGAVSFAYCESCARQGIEPYGAVIAYLSCAVNNYSEIKSNFYKGLVDRTLLFYNKTIDDFNNDITACREQFYNDMMGEK